MAGLWNTVMSDTTTFQNICNLQIYGLNIFSSFFLQLLVKNEDKADDLIFALLHEWNETAFPPPSLLSSSI